MIDEHMSGPICECEHYFSEHDEEGCNCYINVNKEDKCQCKKFKEGE